MILILGWKCAVQKECTCMYWLTIIVPQKVEGCHNWKPSWIMEVPSKIKRLICITFLKAIPEEVLCVFPWRPVRWIALCFCLPEIVWFISVRDYHMQVWIKAQFSLNESPPCPVSFDRWPALQLWSTYQESFHSSMQIAETVLGGWQQCWWRHSLWRRCDISMCLCVSQQINMKFMGRKEEKLEQGVFQCAQKCWKVLSAHY